MLSVSAVGALAEGWVPIVIDLVDVAFRYGSAAALRGISAQLSADSVALLGPNGAGKSTLMGLMSTSLAVQQGTVTVNGCDLGGLSARERARRVVGYVPQAMELPPGWTCAELLAYACWMRGVRDGRAAVEEALQAVDLADRAEVRIRQLSGGMRQRLCVAQALVHRPAVVLVDEPTVGLDPLQRVQLRETLSALSAQVVMATHLVDDVAALAEQVIILDGGVVVADAPIEQLCGAPVTAATVEAAYLRHVLDGERP